MKNVTLTISEDLHKKMKRHSEMNWSEIIRASLEKKMADLELMDKILSGSRLTEKDIGEISDSINRNAAKKLGII